MIDPNILREDPDAVRKLVADRQTKVDVGKLIELDKERRTLRAELENVAHERNRLAEQHRGSPPSDDEVSRGKELKQRHQELEERVRSLDVTFDETFATIPNFVTSDTPVGPDESANVVLRKVGAVPRFSFQPKEHFEIGERLGLIDNERAAKVAGSRFTYVNGDLALMEFALLQFALHTLTDQPTLASIAKAAGMTDEFPTRPFVPSFPPVLVKEDTLRKMARLEPEDERYLLQIDNLYLAGSAEHVLGPMHMDETFLEDDLPLRYVGFSPAFRREAGSYGKDVRGVLRMHQFDKIEMESFTLPELSVHEQEFFVAVQEHFMQTLGLPYQVVLICTGDMGAPDARQIDIEAWFPGQQRYRETHTADLMTDYQARRLHTKVKRTSGKTELVHMNDATALAMGRTMAAILENYQQEDGSVGIPEVLRPLLGGRDVLRPSPLARPRRSS